ncbi:F0F1 ATP synthase subunit A [Sphingomonas koreensis]|uniref:ATP synthase subunit a n=1 Tax=Sphingomonas koreensis TaxID=93064 RepID=A0A1L6JH16_9SPHN|nr:F0F1 ATP synthase subunit A [Sphingomonas koreensis]APR55215.1 F0F1 ATP synthase subunit A [Sphingomonas koreensis]MDC7809545.1 F0F1 ATP synthase subunit A [Sphingomonas koreensis]PJI89857.1 ATP synthase F0 subcomplex A subunit [Sphingomonas koreensis]RSU20654.1 F0F1 ATP synthase subunit A [Sphingomonas koreensis]RSU28950.1 F0F1 ATP synthase subunit A [Sphingomonas koreensis]
MHQFEVQSIADMFNVGGHQIAFTNSALWLIAAAALLWVFMLGGMKRQVVPGRWQMAVEGFTGFIDKLLEANIGKEGRKFLPYVFSLFMFILFANIVGLLPLGLIPGVHPFTATSHFTVTGVLAILSFSIVLIVGFGKHGLRFFKLFVPHGTPIPVLLLVVPIEMVSFMVRPFSLALRLFVAMTAGHILLKVLAGFIIMSGPTGWAIPVGAASFALMIGVSALELLVAGVQAYVFALLTSLYINDAVHLHEHH